ncbi:MAG TPA: hypothetical protein PLJ77_01535 [Dokdonella sp.]|nr:hypothetical protein [Dokdonella sp.]
MFMISHKTLLACGIAAAFFSISSADAATLQASHTGAVAQPSFTVPNGSTVLFDQTANPSASGVTAQNFSSGFDAYDNEAADDFAVPAGGWTLSSVNLVTSTSGGFTGPTTVSVNIYPDATGVPGTTAACSYAAAPAVIGATSTTITLPSTCSLAAGTYWLAASIALDFTPNGQVFWTNVTVGSLSDSVWRNPGDGFATGCTDWGTLAACGVGGGVDPGYSFQLLGAVGGGGVPAAPVQELPTLNQWSALLAAGGLALLGLFGVRRRARR